MTFATTFTHWPLCVNDTTPLQSLPVVGCTTQTAFTIELLRRAVPLSQSMDSQPL